MQFAPNFFGGGGGGSGDATLANQQAIIATLAIIQAAVATSENTPDVL